MSHSIYTLASSVNPDEVRYVGLTGSTVEGSLASHLHGAAGRESNLKTSWIRSVQAAGGTIVATTLESGLTPSEAQARERFHISEYLRRGDLLTNVTSGDHSVYTLASSLNPDEVRYVGLTGSTIERRLARHILSAEELEISSKASWIRSVQYAGGTIVAATLESGLTPSDAQAREIFHIAHYRSLGAALTNMTEGGEIGAENRRQRKYRHTYRKYTSPKRTNWYSAPSAADGQAIFLTVIIIAGIVMVLLQVVANR